MKDFFFLNLHSMPQHAMHFRAYIEAQKDIKTASNDGNDPSNYYVLTATSSGKKKLLNFCITEHSSILKRHRDAMGSSSCRQEICLLERVVESSCDIHLEDFISWCREFIRSVTPLSSASTWVGQSPIPYGQTITP